MNRRTGFLQEMGVGPVWKLRDTTHLPDMTAASPQDVEHIDDVIIQEDVFPQDDIPPMEDIPSHYFDQVPFEDETDAPVRADVSRMNWEQLEETIAQCTACGLCKGRTQTVPGVGDRKAAWLFVGEGPGFVEDQQGEPFVGPSGKLLDNMLAAIGIKRGENAYIANVVKCRPTDGGGQDRPPTPEEAKACKPYLDRQIALIQPKVIVALGRIASTNLLGTEPQTMLATLRGKAHTYTTQDGTNIPLIATYHPAYLLRQLSEKKKAWVDLCSAIRIISG